MSLEANGPSLWHVNGPDIEDVITTDWAGAADKSTYVEDMLRGSHAWVEKQIEGGRPQDRISRTSAVFAFENAANACCYARTLGQTTQVYEVRAEGNTCRGVWCLLERLRVLGPDDPRINEITKAYWETDARWKFIEVLAERFVVIGKYEPEPLGGDEAGVYVAPSQEGVAAHASDAGLAARLWPWGSPR